MATGDTKAPPERVDKHGRWNDNGARHTTPTTIYSNAEQLRRPARLRAKQKSGKMQMEVMNTHRDRILIAKETIDFSAGRLDIL